ncbi:unnamed protein product [Effrenium voratum]|nr:unnamed protein product [Effrenium voratum]
MHQVDRPPMPAFARQLPASSGESGQDSGWEEDGRTRRPGAYSRSAEDWDAFMELGDSAHVHARGGMSAQSRAAIGEADATWRAKFLWAARTALERLEKEKHEAAFLRAAAQARTAAQEAQEAHQAAQHQAELAKSREEQRNVKQAMEVEDLAQQLEDAKRRNQELQEAAQAAAAAEQKVRQEARQARSEAEAAALNARESEQIAAQHAQEVVNQAASLAELRARLGVQQHMAQVQENAAQRALAIAGPNASHAVAWPGPPLEEPTAGGRRKMKMGLDPGKALAFELHYDRPRLAWGSVVMGLAVAMFSYLMGRCSRHLDGPPMWYSFFAASLTFATLLGAFVGDYLYAGMMEASFDFQNLGSYPAVDPSRQKGQQLMDAGRVYFASGSKLDLAKSMSFQNFEEYCVVPIVKGDDELASYDFWAVGVNCCDQRDAVFRCGEFGNTHARSGLRYMEEGNRQYFRLAVQQAEAAFGIKANHPLFFTWTQDPLALVTAKVDTAWRLYGVGVGVHFFTNLFVVIVALMGFSRLGHF